MRSPRPGHRPTGRRWYALLPGLLLVWVPPLLFALGLGLAEITGCRVDEASRHPCTLAGIEIGGLLYTLFMMGWLLILLLPFMGLTLVLGLGWALLALYRRWRA